MATERELKIRQEELLFDIMKLIQAESEKEIRAMLTNMYERAQSGMTVEEVAAVKERVARSKSKG